MEFGLIMFRGELYNRPLLLDLMLIGNARLECPPQHNLLLIINIMVYIFELGPIKKT